MELNEVVLVFVGFIGLMVLFAQLKMFSVARDVQKIRELLEAKISE